MDRRARLHHDSGSGADRVHRDHRLAVKRIVTVAALAVGLSACGEASELSGGAKVFSDAGCGSCHRLDAANAEGTAGPSLEGRMLSPSVVERAIREGATGMPGYAGRLDESQIEQLTRFLAK